MAKFTRNEEFDCIDNYDIVKRGDTIDGYLVAEVIEQDNSDVIVLKHHQNKLFFYWVVEFGSIIAKNEFFTTIKEIKQIFT